MQNADVPVQHAWMGGHGLENQWLVGGGDGLKHQGLVALGGGRVGHPWVEGAKRRANGDFVDMLVGACGRVELIRFCLRRSGVCFRLNTRLHSPYLHGHREVKYKITNMRTAAKKAQRLMESRTEM